jgi:hypothetical protein
MAGVPNGLSLTPPYEMIKIKSDKRKCHKRGPLIAYQDKLFYLICTHLLTLDLVIMRVWGREGVSPTINIFLNCPLQLRS